MPDDQKIPFDYLGARKSGYSDDEIKSFLKQKYSFDFDITNARKSGYSDKEIADYITAYEPEKKKGLLSSGALGVGSKIRQAGSLIGGVNGSSQSNGWGSVSSDPMKGIQGKLDPEADARIKKYNESQPSISIKPITNAGINLEHDDPLGELIKPSLPHILSGFSNDKRNVSESTGQLPVLKSPKEKSSVLTPQQERHIATTNIDLAEKSMQHIFPDGKVAEEYLQNRYAKDGKLPENNATVNYAFQKANELEDWNKKLTENPDLTHVAVDIARGNDENLDKQITALEQGRFAGHPNIEQRKQEVKQAGYYYDNMLPPEQQAAYTDQLIHDPNTKLIAEKNPAVKQQLDYLLNGGLYERFPAYGKNKILNEVSQEYERENNKWVFDPASPYKDKKLNDIADKLYANQPALKKIVDENFRDNWAGKIDNPTITSRFAEGFTGAAKGQGSSLLDWAGLGPSKSERVYHNLQNEFSGVSAGESGFKKDVGSAANFAGMITEMAVGAKVVGATKAMSPAITGMALNASTFYDGLKDQYTMMFPDNAAKAETGATLSTLAFTFAYKAFPSTKLAEAVSKKMQPEVAEVLSSLESGAVSKEAKANFLSKLKDVTVGTLGKNFEGVAQMTAITAGQNAFDQAIGITPEAQKKYEQSPVTVARNMAIGLAVPSLIQSVGGINAAAKNVNRVADSPMMYKRALDGMLRDRVITQKQYDKTVGTIDHLATVKQEMIDNGTPEKNMGRALLESLHQKQLAESKPTDPVLLKQHNEKIKDSQEIQQRVMAGENPDTIITESQQKIIDEKEKTDTELERLKIDNELDNKKVDAKIENTDGRKSEENRVKLQELKEEKRRINEDYEKQVAKLTPKETLPDQVREVDNGMTPPVEKASNTDNVVEIGTTDNTNTILEKAEKKGGIYSELAKAIKGFLGNVKTVVTDAFKSDVSEHGDYGQNEIAINNKTNKNKLHIFFHEALHHITREKIQDFESNPNSKNLKPHEVSAIIDLKRIFKKVTEKLNQDEGGFGTQKGGQSPKNMWLLDATGNKRGLANVHEFISEAFTNPEFQKILKDFKGEGKSPTIFKQFLDAVAKMLGLKDPTILDDIFHHTEKLTEQKSVESTPKGNTSNVGGDVEARYNERKKSIEDKLNQQLEDNKDRLDDIDEKGGTKTVRQKIYQEHTNDMVELEKWKMKEDLKSEKSDKFDANKLENINDEYSVLNKKPSVKENIDRENVGFVSAKKDYKKANEISDKIKLLRSADGSISEENMPEYKRLRKEYDALEQENNIDRNKRVERQPAKWAIDSFRDSNHTIGGLDEVYALKKSLKKDGYTDAEIDYIIGDIVGNKSDLGGKSVAKRFDEINKNRQSLSKQESGGKAPVTKSEGAGSSGVGGDVERAAKEYVQPDIEDRSIRNSAIESDVNRGRKEILNPEKDKSWDKNHYQYNLELLGSLIAERDSFENIKKENADRDFTEMQGIPPKDENGKFIKNGEEYNEYIDRAILPNLNKNIDNFKEYISEAYQKSKKDGTNPELVKAVEKSLSKQESGGEQKTENNGTQKANEEGGGSDQPGKQQAEEIIPPVKPAAEEGAGTGTPPPGKPTGGDTVEGDDPELTKIANAVNDQLIKDKFGVDALDGIIGQLQDTDLSKTYGTIKEKVQKGTLDPKLTRDKVLTQKSGNATDQAVLLYDMAQLKGQEKDLRRQIIESTDPKEKKQLQEALVGLQNSMMDNALANRYIGRDWHNIGKIRQQWVNKDYNIVDMQNDYMASKGISELTEEQKAEIQGYHDAIKDLEVQRDKAREERDAAVQESERLKAENEVLQKLKGKSNKDVRVKRTDEQVAKSNERIQKAKDELKNMRGQMNDVTRVLPKTAALISRIAAEKVYQGVLKFGDLVREILDDVRDVFPEWTEKDVAAHLLNEAPNYEKYYEAGKSYDLSKGDLRDKIKAYDKINKEYALKQFEWQKDRRNDLMKNRSTKEKMIDGVLRWQRFAILSYPTTLIKLAAVVVHQAALKPLKFAIQKFITAPISRGLGIASKQGIWAEPTWRSLGKYYSEMLRNFSLANLKEQFGGIDTKEILYGDRFMYDEWAAAKGLLEMPGRSHGYIKSFIKNPEFKFAQENLATQHIGKMAEISEKMKDDKLSGEEKTKLKDEYDNWDVTNPDVMERINKLSLEHGKWAILMNDNNFTKKFQSWTKDNGFSGALIKSELPIVKIPLNYIYRSFATKYGLIRAITGKGKWESKENHFPGLVEMAFKGTKDLTPKQADIFGRVITLGSMGATFFTMGYLMRSHIKQNDDGSYDIFGMHINKNFIHSPEFESIFSGAKTGHEFDKKGGKGVGNWIESFVESDIEIAKKSPFVNMLKYGFTANIATALLSKNDDNVLGKIRKATFKKISDMVIPGALKQTAGAMDVKGKNFDVFTPPTKREPTGSPFEQFLETMELGIPVLRQNVKQSQGNTPTAPKIPEMPKAPKINQ